MKTHDAVFHDYNPQWIYYPTCLKYISVCVWEREREREGERERER